MAGVETTPTDQLTGLPLPIFTKRSTFYAHKRNYHHHFHPQRSPELATEFEGKPVRYSRGQDLPTDLHNRYHDIFFGPPLPQTRKDKFTSSVLALSGVMPRQAIDLYKPGDFRVVELNDDQHTFMARPSRLHPDKKIIGHGNKRQGRVRRFFTDYVVEQALEDTIRPEDIEKFIWTPDENERRILGRLMLEAAVDTSVADLIPLQEKARQEKMLIVGAKAVREVVSNFFSNDAFYRNLREEHARLVSI